jgi:hypothetical protein
MMSTHMSINIRHQNWSYQKRWCYNHLLTTDKFTESAKNGSRNIVNRRWCKKFHDLQNF